MAAVFCWLLCCSKCNGTASHKWLHLLTHLPAPKQPWYPALFNAGIENKKEPVLECEGWNGSWKSFNSAPSQMASATKKKCHCGTCHNWWLEEVVTLLFRVPLESSEWLKPFFLSRNPWGVCLSFPSKITHSENGCKWWVQGQYTLNACYVVQEDCGKK